MQAETVRANGSNVWVTGLIGRQSEQFQCVTIAADDISHLTIADFAPAYDGDGRLLQIGLQAYVLDIAHEGENPPVGLILCAQKDVASPFTQQRPGHS